LIIQLIKEGDRMKSGLKYSIRSFIFICIILVCTGCPGASPTGGSGTTNLPAKSNGELLENLGLVLDTDAAVNGNNEVVTGNMNPMGSKITTLGNIYELASVGATFDGLGPYSLSDHTGVSGSGLNVVSGFSKDEPWMDYPKKSLAADIDNDGDIDLFISAIYPSGESHLFLNDGKGKFKDVSWLSGARMNNTWGSAFSDYDNDGDIDLVIASKNGIRLLNNSGPTGHWIKISLRSEKCNSRGIGARLVLHHQNKHQTRIVTAGRGTGNQDSSTQLFGLGAYSGPVNLRIIDSCGQTTTHDFPEINRHYVINY